MAITSSSAWALCAQPPPDPLTVIAGIVCVESDGNRTGAGASVITVDGTYTGSNMTVLATSGSGVTVGTTGVVVLNGGSVETFGNSGYGFDLRNNGGSLTATNYSVTTHGLAADAVTMSGPGILNLTNVTLTTNSSSASGIEAQLGAIVNGSNVTISTTQSPAGTGDSDGVMSRLGAIVTLRDSTITVVGPDVSGVAVWNGGEFYGENLVISVNSDRNAENPSGLYAYDTGSKMVVSGGTIATSGIENHGLYADGAVIQVEGMNISASGAASSAVYLNNAFSNDLGYIEVTGGSLSSHQAPLIQAEGGIGEVVLNGPIAMSPASIGGRDIFAYVTDLGVTTSDFTLTLNGVTTANGDIDVAGNGNIFKGVYTASDWRGNLSVAAGNTGNLSLFGSRWTGLGTNANTILLNPTGSWTVTGTSNAVTVDNAGLVAFDPATAGFPTLTTTNYIGRDGRLGLNTQLDADGSPSNLLIIDGGSASGTTGLIITNAGGGGAQTVGDGIRVIQAINGATTGSDSFSLGARAAAGAYEYLLHRSGVAGADDWFLRSHLIRPAEPDVPLFRPEVPLYMPIPALARQMGLATLGTLHERVGEQMNIVPHADQEDHVNGLWLRMIAQGGNSSWQGPMNVRATNISLAGLHGGLDLYRAEHENGHRDHLGLYAAYTGQTAWVEGFALGVDRLVAGKVHMSGPAIGAYWTTYNPDGGYLDGVLQVNLFSVTGESDFGTRLGTSGLGFTASLEAGQPFALGEGWEIEPQGQLIYQSMSINTGDDAFSSVAFGADSALTGRIGLRLQHTSTDDETVFQPYAKVNLWHGFGGTDTTTFAATSFDNAFGGTALELGAGFTAKVSDTVSLYGHIDHRWSVGGREHGSATQGALGFRVNW